MKKSIFTFLYILLVIPIFSYGQQKNVLIFSKTTGFRHANIEKGAAVLQNLLHKNGINSIHSEDANYFSSDSLKTFDAVIFLSTTGDLFNNQQKEAFQNFIRSGHGYVGIHAASDTEFNWPWYGQLVGGYFARHPAIQEAKIDVVNRKHLSTKHLNRVWMHRDEWYDFKDVKKGLNILMMLDETSYQGGEMGKFHPIAWFQEFDGGKVFYTGLGHTSESFDSPLFQQHVLGGLKYVLNIKN